MTVDVETWDEMTAALQGLGYSLERAADIIRSAMGPVYLGAFVTAAWSLRLQDGRDKLARAGATPPLHPDERAAHWARRLDPRVLDLIHR